jgi:signal transduction histidine kinase/ActR/RegA family two-component response regulator
MGDTSLAVRDAADTLRRIEAVTDTALARLPLDSLLHELLVRVTELMGADTAAILLVDGDVLRARAAKGLEEEVTTGVRIPIGRGFAGRVASEKRPIHIADVDQAEVLNPILREKGIRSLLGVPILFEGRVIGVLHVGTLAAREFAPKDAQLLQIVADRIGLGVEYARLYRDAADASRLKDEFLATISHELRTPLTPILAWVRFLRTAKLDDAAMTRGLEAIERSARSQAQLVEELLDVSRIITGRLRLNVRPTSLPAVVTAAFEAMAPTAQARNVQVQTILDPRAGMVSGDPERLQQVMWNLLSNAIKFVDKGGRVTLRVERVNSHVEIVVQDNGPGIPPDAFPHLFERFWQADRSTTRVHGGMGLGLAIVRHLVELHGGSVRAENVVEGHGAVFTVRLPLMPITPEVTAEDRRHPAAHEDSAPAAERLDGLRILVVDDERDTCDVIAVIFETAGAETRTAVAADDALDILAEWPADVLVSDIGMPGKDGYQLMREVRARRPEQAGRVLAVALTAYARSEDRRRALSAGYHTHLAKPVDPDELVAVVASLVRR